MKKYFSSTTTHLNKLNYSNKQSMILFILNSQFYGVQSRRFGWIPLSWGLRRSRNRLFIIIFSVSPHQLHTDSGTYFIFSQLLIFHEIFNFPCHVRFEKGWQNSSSVPPKNFWGDSIQKNWARSNIFWPWKKIKPVLKSAVCQELKTEKKN